MTDRRRVAVHELGHGLVGRAVGLKVRYVVTTPDHGFVEHDQPADSDSLGSLADQIVTLLAGEYAETALGDRVSGYAEPQDDCEAAVTAALAQLPADDAGFVHYVLTDSKSPTSDAEKVDRAARRAEVHAEERGAFLLYCSARAWRLVNELSPAIVALIPLALRTPVLSGDDLEAGIAALTGQAGPRP